MTKKNLKSEIEKSLNLLHGGDPVELMYLGPDDTGKEVRGFAYFNDYAVAAELAANYNGDGNLFVNLNTFAPWPGLPFEKFSEYPDFYYTDKNSGIRAVNGADIKNYRWLLVDIDPIRIGSEGKPLEHVSATDAESAEAKNMATEIKKYLEDKFAFPEPVSGCSGNGWHLLYRIDLEGNKEHQTLIKKCLQRLAGKFNKPEAKAEVDTSVYTLPHLTKLYGTVAVKGEDTADRPHRKSFIDYAPDPIEIVPAEKLRKLAASKSATGNKKARSSGGGDEDQDQREWLRNFLKGRRVFLNAENDQPSITLDGLPPEKGDTYCIMAEDFKALLFTEYQSFVQDVTQVLDCSAAISNLKAAAIVSGKHERVYKRVAQINSRHLVYNLNNGQGDVIDVTAAGVKICKKNDTQYRSLHFYAHTNMLPQVTPDFAAATPLPELLDPFLPFNSDEKVLVLCWLLCALLENTKHAILVAVGPEGSGKSSCGCYLRTLIDPQSNRPGALPKDLHNLCLSLGNRYCTMYDNIQAINNETSDLLCQAVQGGSFETRTLYTTTDLSYISFKSTLILTGILPSLIRNPDLKDRCVLLVAGVTDDNREFDDSLDALFEQRRSAIMGQIFNTIHKAMALPDNERPDFRTRMQDFAFWGYRFAKVLWGNGDIFLDAYQTNKGGLITSSLLEDPTSVGPAVICHLQGIPSSSFPLVRNSQTLYDEISETANKRLKINTNFHPWPQSASKFTDKLRILERSLKAFGVDIVRNKTKTAMQVTLYRNDALFAKLPPVKPTGSNIFPAIAGATTLKRKATNSRIIDLLADDADEA